MISQIEKRLWKLKKARDTYMAERKAKKEAMQMQATQQTAAEK